MIRKLLTSASVATLVLGGSLALAGPASAETAYGLETYPAGAMGVFYPTGEWLYVYDTAADGHHATVFYQTSVDSTVRKLETYDGNGSSMSKNLDIPETGWLGMNVCVMEGTSKVRCTGWFTYSAQG